MAYIIACLTSTVAYYQCLQQPLSNKKINAYIYFYFIITKYYRQGRFRNGFRVIKLPSQGHDPDNHDGVITHLQSDIQEGEVKWALGSITTNKASGGDGIPVELFQILKYDAMNMLHSICQQIWETQQWPQDWKRSVFIPISKKDNAKECSNYHTIALISHTIKVMIKILQARLQQYVNYELPVQAGFRKGRRTRDQIANIHWIIKRAKEFHKNIYFCFIDYAKAFDCVDCNKLWKIL